VQLLDTGLKDTALQALLEQDGDRDYLYSAQEGYIGRTQHLLVYLQQYEQESDQPV
jgi:hypothetical protein